MATSFLPRPSRGACRICPDSAGMSSVTANGAISYLAPCLRVPNAGMLRLSHCPRESPCLSTCSTLHRPVRNRLLPHRPVGLHVLAMSVERSTRPNPPKLPRRLQLGHGPSHRRISSSLQSPRLG